MNHTKFIELLSQARIIDSRTGVKGSVAYAPLGMKLRNQIIIYWKEFVESLGYDEVLFPILIPENNFNSFDLVFPVKNKMFHTEFNGKKFFLKPTGECEIYPIVKHWLKEWGNLPIKVYQIGSQLRPHKDTSIMLNGDEQLTLMEAHSFHETKESALNEYLKIIDGACEFSKKYGLPFLIENRCDWKNKHFYEKECSVGTWIFSKDRSFCNTVIYHQGDNFSKIFGLEFNNKPVYQNTFGVNAERILVSLLSIYSEEEQLVIPPHIYPKPFFTKENPVKISKKFGYPLVIGEKKAIRIDTGESIDASMAIQNITKLMSEIKTNLEKKAQLKFNSVIVEVSKKEDIAKAVSSKKLARFSWCGCDNARIFEDNIPGEYVGYVDDFDTFHKCIFCENQSNKFMLAAKRTTSP